MIELFDIQTGFGGANRAEAYIVTADEWLQTMTQLEIGRALVRFEPDALDVDCVMANEIVFAACQGRSDLVPCPVALPATGGDVPPEDEQLDGFIRRGAGAALIRPGHDDWQFLPFVYGNLLNAFAVRRLPVYCLERYLPVLQIAELAGRYPDLPIILAGVSYRSQRTFVPLLQTYANVHLSIGSNFTIHRGLEHMVGLGLGAQLLFGTGFPAAEPMMAITQLIYADLTDAQKADIGARNFERLLAGVIR